MDTAPMPDDQGLIRLQSKWQPAWRIWRARNSCDIGAKRTGDYVASRIDDTAGVDPTVMCGTADGLDDALIEQWKQARAARQAGTAGEL